MTMFFFVCVMMKLECIFFIDEDATVFRILIHLRRMEFPTSITWTSPFSFSGLLGGIFHFHFNRAFYKQTVETQRFAASALFAYVPQKGR